MKKNSLEELVEKVKDDNESFIRYLLGKNSNITDAVTIKTKDDWLGLCKHCGSLDLGNSDLRYDFYIYHEVKCWLVKTETEMEIEFLDCLR